MRTVFVTGATGNVGMEVIKALQTSGGNMQLIAGVRDPSKQKNTFTADVELRSFDFENPSTHQQALQGVDTLFLLRPPQLANVQKYFAPIIDEAKSQRVRHIVFLSVQGADTNTMIPHHKIEKLIMNSGIDYTLFRPAYFMQNFLTTLKEDLVRRRMIYLPAGKATFTLVDVRDIGSVAAKIIQSAGAFKNKGYDLTSNEALSFAEMAQQLTEGLNRRIHYKSANLLAFVRHKRKQNLSFVFIFVMIMLHYFPRFQKQPPLSNSIKEITGKDPISFEQFVRDHKKCLLAW